MLLNLLFVYKYHLFKVVPTFLSMSYKTLTIIHFLVFACWISGSVSAEIKEMSKKILVTNPDVPKVGLDRLREAGCELIMTPDSSRESILKHAPGVDAIFWATHAKLDKEVLDAAGPQMKTVATMSVGFDHIDLAEIRNRGIKLGHTPNVLNDAVADTAILLTLAASRRLHEGRLAIESGNWERGLQWMLGRDIQGSIVGILGFGRVGQTIGRRLQSFGVKDIYYTHREVEEGKKLGAKFVPFDTLISESDFIIVALPLNNRTANMFNDDLFGKMKDTCVFVNVGRGALVDQPALVRALKEKKIFAAGLDVMTPEPLPTESELLKIPNLVLTPHLGSATVNTRNAMSDLTARNILKGLAGEEMVTPVKL